MSPSSAAMNLREAFGDRKIPEISRKITACVACRKLKIKCHMDGKPPCSRCKLRGLSCTVNKSLQMLLENDASWKETIERRLDNLERASLNSAGQQPNIVSRSQDVSIVSAAPEPAPTVTLNLSCSLGAFPASSIVNLTFNTAQGVLPGRERPDLVSRHVIPHDVAEGFFAFYQQHLDPCIHQILLDTDTLATTRSRSSILTAAVCAVAAFCTGSKHYQSCFSEFKAEVSRKLFAASYTFDDVRALCIGVFWLNEISAALNGLGKAVRIATELDLHRCITKMPHIKKQCYDRTRLYFLVYLCDHHSSLSHGRPPLTRDFHSLKSPRDFLQSKFSTEADLNLISQIELWSIGSRVFDVFGADIENPVVGQRSSKLAQFSAEYDRWYGEWVEVLLFNEKRETVIFPRRVFDLYFYSARLYLLSHVFRGWSQDEHLSSQEGTVDTFAQRALQSALSIVRCIVDGDEGVKTQSWLGKLPLYFGTMTAFASVCLLRASAQHQTMAGVGADEIPVYLRRLIGVLRRSLPEDHPTHPLLSIAESLDQATSGLQESGNPEEKNHDENTAPDFDFDIFTNDGAHIGLFRDSNEWMSFLRL